MKKAQRIKRRAVGRIIWQAVGTLEHCMYQLGEHLHVEGGTPVHRKNPLKGALTDTEFEALRKCIAKTRVQIENFRKIAKHVERGTDEA